MKLIQIKPEEMARIDGDNPDIFCQIINIGGLSYWVEV